MTFDCECVVVGAGVVGLAIAAELARSGREVLIIEKESTFGTATSARNSEVIHAGIYYPAGSLKAQFCVEGKQRLYRYCEERYVDHRRCGKLIVATTEAQVTQLQAIARKAEANGVSDLQRLSRRDALELEPELDCLAALFSPSTGIIDSHALMVSLLAEAEEYGAVLASNCAVESIVADALGNGLVLSTRGDDAMRLSTSWLVNAAGHGACSLAASIDALPGRCCPEPVMTKGNYFRLLGPAPFSRLVYPAPEPGGLGVHITLDLGGQARFGPDVEPIENEDYTVDPHRSESFYAAIRNYWPGLGEDSLAPDYAGLRPKIRVGGLPYSDFLVQSPADHGVPGLVNLFGIESPGLTASLAIGRHVRKLCGG